MTLQQDYIEKGFALKTLYWQREGLTAMHVRDYTTALLALTVYGAFVPGDASAYYFRALAQQRSRSSTASLRRLSTAISLRPDEPMYYLRRAQIYHAWISETGSRRMPP